MAASRRAVDEVWLRLGGRWGVGRVRDSRQSQYGCSSG